MKDQLPTKPMKIETGIINLDNSNGEGTHWVAYVNNPRAIVSFFIPMDLPRQKSS